MSAIGQPAEGSQTTETTTAAETPAAPDYTPIIDRVGELASGLEGLRGLVESRLPAPEQTPDPDPWEALGASLFGEQTPDPAAQQPQAAPAMDLGQLREALLADVRNELQPVLGTVSGLQQQQALGQLYQVLPQLAPLPADHADHQAHEQARAAAHDAVQRAVASYPPQVQQVLVNDPNFIANVVRAEEGLRLAQGQRPAEGGNAPTLESATGAAPAGSGEQPSIVQQAYEARRGIPSALL